MKPCFLTVALVMLIPFVSYSNLIVLDDNSQIILDDEPQVVLTNRPPITTQNIYMGIGSSSTSLDVQRAVGFRTGSERSVLHRALFRYDSKSHFTENTFKFSLHSDNSELPGKLITHLDGPDRPVNGITWYNAPEHLVLESNTTYWLVASAPQTATNQLYFWAGTTGPNYESYLAGWEMLNHGASMLDNGIWESFYGIGHTSIEVKAIPEPTFLALTCFIGSGLWFFRRMFKKRLSN